MIGFLFDWLPSIATIGGSFLFPGAGLIAGALSLFGKLWFRAVLIVIAFLALGSWGAAQRVMLADQKVETAKAESARDKQGAQLRVEKANREAVDHDLTECERANAATLKSIDRIREWSGKSIAALEAVNAAAKKRKPKTQIIVQQVDNAPNHCDVPDPYRAFFDGLRDEQRRD